jgi:hypothetical protein
MAGTVALVAAAAALCIPGDSAQDVTDGTDETDGTGGTGGPDRARNRTRGARNEAMEGA